MLTRQGGELQAPTAPEPPSQVDEATWLRSPDGLRHVEIHNGRAFLVYDGDAMPPGSVDSNGEPVPLEYPLAVSSPDELVLDAAFQLLEHYL